MISPSLVSATATLRALAMRGMEHLVVSPGSRSAPLAYAAAAAQASGALSVHVRIDERDAAFTALGIARSTGLPCAVVTTSGTAVGELLPAVMEASHAGVPLVVLSADRPPELRGTGANQTTRQPGMFANYVRAAVDLVPPDDPQLSWPRQCEDVDSLLDHVLAALPGDEQDPPGPVHVNVALRDPLYPVCDDDHRHLRSWARDLASEVRAVGSGGAARIRVHPWSVLPEPFLPPAESVRVLESAPRNESVRVTSEADGVGSRSDAADSAARQAASTSESSAPAVTTGTAHPVVFAGDGAGPAAARSALEHSLPLLAEPSSQARAGETAIASYESVLDSPLGDRVDSVILVGRPTLSRRVSALLKRPDVRVIAVRPDPAPWFEHGRRPEDAVGSFEEAASAVGPAEPGWLEAWREAGAAADAAVLRFADDQPSLTRLHVARAVWDAACADGSVLVVGSSNIVRDLDLVARAQGPMPVIANRGLAGIDGTVATAHGVGLGAGRPVRAVMGDLTFLHDAGGLLLGPGERVPDLHVIVVNDSGGGIFQTLEHGDLGRDPRYTATVERFFGTSHTVGIAELCAAYGVQYVRADTAIELAAALAAPVAGRRVIEVTLDRQSLRDFNVAARDAGARAVREYLEGEPSEWEHRAGE
ncbi:2-succinyl-5-enolpyruvyl-6-hydroxy-3-cyclohexene-1-carboxylic-acid synthase [Kocuria marina]|uniref:2-succinyl-5-enolpyruvyl-6-hydroxy-3- cyclohexene-1-carboxylic-acid synthase n=1 Tax=Kocuria marina TaxID=223184 RepID=UPI002989BE25|nr:2-succinyl-5-enolpyruvyl-6-hydroxy-3-cyclohexene-1-carboxylic-acid synthase [Kocuria marina]MCT2020053.1 2-succinyl-5-enolpyruvyl-6-hydroxy-3-cyclohexene-1-carboxylic-acid synthase [Kocuria marina]